MLRFVTGGVSQKYASKDESRINVMKYVLKSLLPHHNSMTSRKDKSLEPLLNLVFVVCSSTESVSALHMFTP